MAGPTAPAVDVDLSSRFRDALPELAVDQTAGAAPDPELLVLNDALAAELGLDAADLRSPAGLGLLTGTTLPTGAHPVAMGYAGHQFGSYNPRLGDGRALLLGELTSPDGRIVDLHLKGSGRTPFARGGDGLAALGPMLREYVTAEAMHSLGVPTTRSLAVVATGGPIRRPDDATAAILARTASSHLRVGMFEYAARLPDPTVLRRLADFAVGRHHPDLADVADDDERYGLLLRRVVDAQASLVAQWMLLGFIHGVMNTDNTTISGETIDYGPCALMDRFDPDAVFSSIDHAGRYRYGNQPRIMQWNLTRFAETLLPLHADVDTAVAMSQHVLEGFPHRYETHWNSGMRRKLGLVEQRDDDGELFAGLFDAMETTGADLTATFRSLAGRVRAGASTDAAPVATAIERWERDWRERLASEGRPSEAVAAELDAVNPVYVPRNHLVEEALAAARAGDLAPFHHLFDLVTHPFEERPGDERYARPAPDSFTSGYRTFCGT